MENKTSPNLSDLENSGKIEYDSTIGSVSISKVDDEDEHENAADASEDVVVVPDLDESHSDIAEEAEETGRGKRKRTRRGIAYGDYDDEKPKKRRAATADPKDDPDRVISRRLADVCTSACNICGKVGPHDSILKHITSKHKETQKDNYVMLTRSYYKCRICDSEMVFFVGRIKEHMKRTHKITLQEYKDEYNELKDKVANGRTKKETDADNFSKCKLCGEIAEHDETRQHVQNVHNEPASLDNYEFVTKDDLKVQTSLKKHETEVEEIQEIIAQWKHTTLDGAPQFFTDKSNDKCLRQCELCEKIYSEDSLRGHLRQHHKDDMDKKAGKDHRLIKLTFHRCRVCDKELRFTFNIVSKHLKKYHNLKMTEYRLQCNVFLDEESPNLYSASFNAEDYISGFIQNPAA